MIDPISLAVGAGLFGLGLLAGKLPRRRARVVDTVPQQPVCGCAHGLEQHDPDSKECHGEVLHRNAYSPTGRHIGDQRVRCTCRQYVGPRPLEELYAPPLLPPQDSAGWSQATWPGNPGH